jgi:uncharacterized repeat protein (TIGR03843 family)
MPASLQPDAMIECLQKGEFEIEGQFMWGSNYTYLGDLTCQNETFKVVYKPLEGEQPLWDFPEESLAGREVAAYLVSEALGWHFVPPTVYRPDGPAGPGSLQQYIEHDPNYHYFNFSPADRQRLRSVALFDALVNNTDRKGGHVLIDPEGRLWLIDHGICFHAVPKLRTVIWDFAGQAIADEECAHIMDFLQQLAPESALIKQLAEHLLPYEIRALRDRTGQLLSEARFPLPIDNRRSYPWPPV